MSSGQKRESVDEATYLEVLLAKFVTLSGFNGCVEIVAKCVL